MPSILHLQCYIRTYVYMWVCIKSLCCVCAQSSGLGIEEQVQDSRICILCILSYLILLYLTSFLRQQKLAERSLLHELIDNNVISLPHTVVEELQHIFMEPITEECNLRMSREDKEVHNMTADVEPTKCV